MTNKNFIQIKKLKFRRAVTFITIKSREKNIQVQY
jgi:hypothetical protein